MDLPSGDLTSVFFSILTSYGTYLVLLGIAVLLLLVVWLQVSGRYPTVRFLVFEGKSKFEAKRRLMDDKVVPDNLIEILMNGVRMIGPNIRDFDYIVEKGTLIYLATMRGSELIPLRLKEAELSMAELGLAREIAIRYVNTIDATRQDLLNQNPLILSLIAVIPFAVILLLNGLVFYFSMNDAIPKLTGAYTYIADMQHQSLELTANITEDLAKVAEKLPEIQENSMNNGTIYVSGGG